MLPLFCDFVCMWLPNNIWVAFWLRMKLILGDSTETLSGFQTQDKILDLLSTPELLFKEKVDKKKQYFLGRKRNIFPQFDHCQCICGHASNIIFKRLRICCVVKNIALIIDDAMDALCRANMTGPIAQEASS